MRSKTKRYRLPVVGIIILSSFIGIPKVLAGGATSVATVPTTLPAPTTTTVAPPLVPPPLVPPSVVVKWQKVAWCETHANWHHNGSRYDGGLGIMPHNWIAFGGQQFAPAAHLAAPEEQIVVAIRIQVHGGAGSYVPDQNGTCAAW